MHMAPGLAGCLFASLDVNRISLLSGSVMSRRDLECKVYVGDLPRDASEKDIEKAFTYYGNLRSVWVARNPPGFAFVEFDDPRDAEDAVRDMDGR